MNLSRKFKHRNMKYMRLYMALRFALIAAVRLSDAITVVHHVYHAAGVPATVHKEVRVICGLPLLLPL